MKLGEMFKSPLALGSLKGILEAAALMLIPQVVNEGFGSLPDPWKGPAAYVLAPFRSEFGALAARTATPIDDSGVAAIYQEIDEWCEAHGAEGFAVTADDLLQFKIGEAPPTA